MRKLRFSIFKSILLLFVLSMSFVSFSQSKSSLQAKKKKLQKEIAFTNKLLKENTKNKNSTLRDLKQLNRKISSRQNLILTMEVEVEMLNDSIELYTSDLDSLNANLDTLKMEYAEMIRNAQRNQDTYNKLMFIFSADNFNQAFKRLKYFQEYANYRQSQAEQIVFLQEKINTQIAVLNAIKQSKQGLMKAKQNEFGKLTSEKSKQQKVVNSLKGKEKELRAQLKAKQLAARKVAKAIEKIIADEIRKAREAAKKAGNKEEGFPMTPEAKELSKSFVANKGKLPWPVEEGIITGQFGEHPHPTLKNVKVQNNGVDISTKKGSMGRAIFEGTVTRVFIVPGEGKAVMIRHGEYFSVYFYFKEVIVSAGDKIETKQSLGVLQTDENENSSNMHLEIWKITNKLNPESWIYRK